MSHYAGNTSQDMPWSTDPCHSGESLAGLGSSKHGSDREEAQGDDRPPGLARLGSRMSNAPSPEGLYGRIAKGFGRDPGRPGRQGRPRDGVGCGAASIPGRVVLLERLLHTLLQ